MMRDDTWLDADGGRLRDAGGPEPDARLEERTVARLKAEGLLHPPRATRPAGGWLAAGIAAALACFLGGVTVGQSLGARQTADVVTQVRSADAQQMAAAVQQAGSAYIAALASLGVAADRGDERAVTVGREVAMNAFRAAADEVARIAPDDPLVAMILQANDAAARQGDAARGTQRRVVWF